MGKDDIENAQIDAVVDFYSDYNYSKRNIFEAISPYLELFLSYKTFTELVGPIAYADNDAVCKSQVQKALNKIIPNFLERIDRYLERAGGQFFVGGKVRGDFP